ncbi:hypothetical protein [Streptomyces sp. Ag109_O5-10]|uniref:hypothetical protein n=1 Tax=Streptomyces sp. Ag109_O5-10 TaxID=1855349 RepID=UPI0008943159|nr:hypothetical protein [Streptomyces sp. Ag109_O5-10]SEF03556.1 hypothetical protein SAMN05216533_5391 [Streptomyces sp. Ag109_O5-10]
MKSEYKQWHEVLSSEFFGADNALRSTVLYVDFEVERELADRVGMGLAEAVAGELNWSDPDRPLFSRIQRECEVWEQQGSAVPPPSLPVLALSVLAATRMASSDGMLKTNFYGRWIQLFGEQLSSSRANKLEHAFQDVAVMWEELDTWLEQTGGLYGTSTVSTDEFYWKIGFPISQALVRGSDRQVLTRFFAATRLRPHNPDEVSGRELLRRLRVWTAGRDRRLSPRLMEELSSAPDTGETLIASLVKRLADDWDGTLHEPEREHRRRAVGLRLVVADRGRRLEWLADACVGIDETSVAVPGGRTFTLYKAYGEVYEGLESLHPSWQQLEHGLHLEGDDLVLEWAPQEVVLLRLHPHLGEWVSTEYFEPGEQHWILAADSALRAVRSMVDALGGRTVREASAPVPGWKLFKGVRAVNGVAFARTLDRGGDHAHVLEPQIRHRAALSGGLRIAPEYRAGAGVAGHFLRGGAPDLLLPASDSPDGRVEVVLDGRTEKLRADPRVPFPLCMIPLEEGDHRVGTAPSSQVFTLHDGLHEGLPPGTGTLGYLCDGTARPELSDAAGSETRIRGAEAPRTIRLPRTELLRSSVLEAVLLDPHGGVRPAKQQSVPDWMASRLPAHALGPCLEVEVPAGYVWLVYRTAARWSVRALATAEDTPSPAPAPDDYAWAYAVLSAAQRLHNPVWLDYVAAAETISGRRGA